MPREPKPWFWKKRRGWFVSIAGQRHNLGPDRKAARRRFHELMAAPAKREVRSDSVVAIIDGFLDWTKSNRAELTYNWYLGFCQSFVSSIPAALCVHDLKPFHVERWIDARGNCAVDTKRGCITAVKRAFAWAEQQGYIDRSPIAHLKKPQGGRREQVISKSELDAILALLHDDEFSELLVAAWEVGPRPQEIVHVEARHVDITHSRWVFPKEESKGKSRPRIVYLTHKAFQMTKRRMLKYPEDPLFRNLDGRPWNKSAVNSRFLRLKKKLGTKYCLRAFRHTYATRLLESGVDSLTVAILLGHADPSMLARVYQHLSFNPEHLLRQARMAAG